MGRQVYLTMPAGVLTVLSVLRDRASDVIRKHPMGYQICLTI